MDKRKQLPRLPCAYPLYTHVSAHVSDAHLSMYTDKDFSDCASRSWNSWVRTSLFLKFLLSIHIVIKTQPEILLQIGNNTKHNSPKPHTRHGQSQEIHCSKNNFIAWAIPLSVLKSSTWMCLWIPERLVLNIKQVELPPQNTLYFNAVAFWFDYEKLVNCDCSTFMEQNFDTIIHIFAPRKTIIWEANQIYEQLKYLT